VKRTETTGGTPVAIVTGAARGIGRGCALALAEAGFAVALCDRSDEETRGLLDQTVAMAAGGGAECLALTADVAELGEHDAILAAALARWGRADCLVNNAGVGVLQRGDLLDVSPESFDRCIAVNTRAMFFLSQTFARHLLAQGELTGRHRSIINITSSNAGAVSVSRGEYCVSKAGASMATQLFALRLADAGIGVYEIRPGVIETGMTLPVKEQYDARIREGLVPAGRWGYPVDVAAAVVTLAEGRMPYTVGQVIAVDGGLATPRF
jgi:NAD(P)-dependent dehydrogenase (short-subunit alcohol dehydrogenase family)